MFHRAGRFVASERKLRLLAVAWVRISIAKYPDYDTMPAPVVEGILELAEPLADGEAVQDECAAILRTFTFPKGPPTTKTHARLNVNLLNKHGLQAAEQTLPWCCLYRLGPTARYWSAWESQNIEEYEEAERESDRIEEKQKRHHPPFCAALRDVVGNPFRPVTADPARRTPAAVALARRMHEARDFSAMAALADALRDAGCANADVLAHCRAPDAAHFRGCWVVIWYSAGICTGERERPVAEGPARERAARRGGRQPPRRHSGSRRARGRGPWRLTVTWKPRWGWSFRLNSSSR
jgi:hypothetical protein